LLGHILVTEDIMTRRVLAAVAAVFIHVVTGAGAVSQSAAAPAIVSRMGEQVGCIVPAQALRGVKMWAADHVTAGGGYAAWCERKRAGGARLYDLVIAATTREHPWAACAPHLQLGREEPTPQLDARLLPNELPYPIKLSEFWYNTGGDELIEPTPVKSTGVPTGPAIDIGFGDAGNLILCFGKQWVMGGYH
jgi:hypothetical protein